MKRILIIVEENLGLEAMLKKALKLAPESIRLHFFESSAGDDKAATFQATVDNIVKGQCETRLTIETGIAKKQIGARLENVLTEDDYEMIVLHRERPGKDLPDLSLIKAAIRSPTKSTIFLCGDKSWNENAKVLATIDILHDNKVQGSLNQAVLAVAVKCSGLLKAETNILSIIAFSRANTELEIEDPFIVLKKRRAGIEAKLHEFIAEAKCSTDVAVHVAAGLPAVEIQSTAKKTKADIVVVGNVGRTGIKGLLVGNTAEKILNRLHVDAMIVQQ